MSNRVFEMTVRVELDRLRTDGTPSDEFPTNVEAREVVRTALQALKNDGYESDRVSFDSFHIDMARGLSQCPTCRSWHRTEATLAEHRKTCDRRGEGFHALSAEEQWTIDKRLGILDWDGT